MRLSTFNIALFLLLFSSSLLAAVNRYSATVRSVHDGDAITLEIVLDKSRSFGKPYRRDLGFRLVEERTNGYRRLLLVDSVRFDGVQAPELSSHSGERSRDELNRLLAGRTVTLVTIGQQRDKYGRILGLVYLGTTNVNSWLITNRLAVPWDGTGIKPSGE